MHDQLIAEGLEKANIAKAEAILRTALASPVTEYQQQNREWAKGVLADAYIAGARAAQQQQRDLVEKWREEAQVHHDKAEGFVFGPTWCKARTTADVLRQSADELDKILKGMTYQHYSDQLLDELAEARKLASWYALLARTGGKASVILCLDADAVVIQGETHCCTFDDNGLPLEKPEIRAALEKALDQPGETP